MIKEIEEAKNLLEKSEQETIIEDKSELFTDAMEILDKFLEDPEFSDLVKEIKREHIKIFLDQLVELPIEDMDELDIMDMIVSMGDMLFDIIENEMEVYKSASEKLIAIGNKYQISIKCLESLRGKGY